MLARAGASKYPCLVLVLAYCGVRWDEVTGLRGKHPDMLKRRFLVTENAVEIGSRIVVGTPKNHKSPKITPHDLRHSAVSFAVSAGANVKAVQKTLGHSSAAMTWDVYADLFDDDLCAVADALDNAV